jgi:hypothetical protein
MIKINKHPKSMEELQTSVPSGFTMKFDNGNTISVQFGMGNYCANKNKESKTQCTTAEIAIWDAKGTWYKFVDANDEVLGHCSADDVAKWINFAATKTSDTWNPLTGKLVLTESKGWVVRFNFSNEIEQEFDGEVLSSTTRYEELPVHPDCLEMAERLGTTKLVVDFIAQTIAVGTNEFDITDKDVAVII